MNAKRGFIVPLVIVIVALLAIGGGAYVYTHSKPADTTINTNLQATTTVQDTNNSSSTAVKPQTSVSSSDPSLTLISPIGGNKISLKVGEKLNVSWKSSNLEQNGVEKIGIYLQATNKELCQIGLVPVKQNTASIVIPSTCVGTNNSLISDIYKLVLYASNDLSSGVGKDTTNGSLISVTGTLSTNQNWYGKYEFGEVAPANPSGGSVQSWQYNLSISSSNGASRWIVGLNVDGFQTLLRVNATANNVGNSLDVVFDSYSSTDSMQLGYKKGDVLFTLTPTANGLAIQWKKMQPNIPASINGSVFTKVSNNF